MAKGRLIDRKIRTSQTFAQLTYRQRDLWQGLIEVADDQGRLPGRPAYVRSVVWAYDDISLDDVSLDLQVLEDAGNIIRYFVDGSEYIQLVNWHMYQEGAAWLAPSDYPAPEGWKDRCRYHGKNNEIITENWSQASKSLSSPLPSALRSDVPSELPKRDVKDDIKSEDDGDSEGEAEPTEPAAAAADQDNTFANLSTLYEREIGALTPMIAEELKDAVFREKYPPAWYPDAFREAVTHNARSWRYVRRILESWKSKGRKNGNHKGVLVPSGGHSPEARAKYAEWEN